MDRFAQSFSVAGRKAGHAADKATAVLLKRFTDNPDVDGTVNDNWREWDDDLAAGSVHLIETLEFLLALRKIGWDEVILLDQFPFREDPVAAARESIRTVRQLDALLDRLDLEALQGAQARQDALATQRLVLDLFIGRA